MRVHRGARGERRPLRVTEVKIYPDISEWRTASA
ncbi:MAG: hypothetical protein ACI970_001806, partial [Myxococcota bacterium]